MSDQKSYQVLARKYRPATFADLVGQDAMVRTLKNAFEADRIAHAFVMTGVRGVGKTTTARIIAKGMNCVGPDGKGGPTVEPCGQCDPCIAIAEGRHVDVMEMDAASRTGVGDIREIIESVHYSATSARYKIYIIDEVHMLTTNAFNALLKTLEEPPEHVKFIFATTEIRKIPVTVLSRCQRFDLRRMEPEDTIAYLRKLADLEKVEINDEALALITRASEGSMRDAISLLDQAIAHGAGETNADQVRAMLGLADRGRVLDLFDMIMKGDAGTALAELSGQYADGADPMAVLRDLAEITHWTSVIKITPEAADDPTVNPDERARGIEMAGRLPMRALSRMWQMLLKSLEEVAVAPNAMMAAEMAIIRLTHVAELPNPEDLVRKLQANPPTAPTGGGRAAPVPTGGNVTAQRHSPQPQTGGASAIANGGATALAEPAPNAALARFSQFEAVVDMIRANRDMQLLVEIEDNFRLAKYSPGRIEFQMTDSTSRELASKLASRLQSWTGVRWAVSVVSEGGGQTIREVRDAARDDLQAQALAHPMVQAVLAAFPGAEIREVKTAMDEPIDNVVPIDPDDVDDDWDPFEND
ncbi:MAG: DNA polymerase-3 subunit gamma/tau [Paracoccaceae bacterium]|jgi:DNA polymerase-3 subunit gamma/tau